MIITDNTTTGKKNQEAVRRISDRADDNAQQISLVYNVSVDELHNKIQDLNSKTVVLFTIFIRDRNEIFLGYNQGMKLVCDNDTVPV